MRRLKPNEIGGSIEELLEAATDAMTDAYCPYSKFKVGAAILTSKGNTYKGSNIENIAYGSTICAERSAICHANAHGERDYLYVAITAMNGSSSVLDVVAPCGACMQMLYEFAQLYNRDTKIIMSNTKRSKVVMASIRELMPLGFGSEELAKL